jgi:hypothetical protein
MAPDGTAPTLHTQRFPGETDDYRRARDELLRDMLHARTCCWQSARLPSLSYP